MFNAVSLVLIYICILAEKAKKWCSFNYPVSSMHLRSYGMVILNYIIKILYFPCCNNIVMT